MTFAETLPAKVNVDEVLGTLQTRRAFTNMALDLYNECRLLIDAVARQHEVTDRRAARGASVIESSPRSHSHDLRSRSWSSARPLGFARLATLVRLGTSPARGAINFS